ncbi:hypothetical protein RMSM_01524 [Rhodopirellula maiorica SM1]|uniref:Uncharacterized protein n=1 Tax=Rhodopirellula maiorica SM1 TaxID=1265738 RepID=M5RQH3_9BACT|nr:hypothetical protein [Rhodopirellula maiorica]EMI21545.1 hypothetical protein RMSM_01524 [Rhodopirellula maiorica SM1]
MANLKVNPGDAITAARHNQIVERLPTDKSGSPAIVGGMNHCWVPVQNDTENDFEEGDLVSVLDWQGPTDEIYDTQQAIKFLIEEANPDDTGLTYGVCLAPIAAGEPGRAVIAGVAHVNLEITDANHRYAILDSESPRSLTSATYGPWKIVDGVDGTSGDRGIVVFHSDPPQLVQFTLTSDWTDGVATATVKTMTGETIKTANVIDTLDIFTALGSGDKGLGLMQGGIVYIIQAPCGA